MALLKLGSVITEASGKLGGSALQMQGGRCVLFNKSPRRISSSSYQVVCREYMSAANKGWNLLSLNNRNNWNTFASAYSKNFGIIPTLNNPGRALYTRGVYAQRPVYNVLPTAAPLISEIQELSVDHFWAYGAGQDAKLFFNTVLTGYNLIEIYATSPQSKGHVARKSDYRFCTYTGYSPSSPFDFALDYRKIANYIWQPGSVIHFRVGIVHILHGQHYDFQHFSVVSL